MRSLLQGIRVVELGTSVAAPYATLVLAAMGAEVIKVERPESGDEARRWGRSYHGDTSHWFHSLNANKKSVTVDLKDEREIESLRQFIVNEVDVVIQNLRPGRVEQTGLDANTLCAQSESLIYCNLGAFGRTGPLSERPGYDPLMQAFGGPMLACGQPLELFRCYIDVTVQVKAAWSIPRCMKRHLAGCQY